MAQVDAIHLLASAGMVAVIWMVQLVTYPGFAHIDPKNFALAMQHHQHNITYVVAPLMLLEVAGALWGVLQGPRAATLAILLLVIALWLVTFFVQVPLHDQLLRAGFNPETIQRLVQSNWTRTVLWTMKLFVVFGTAIKAL